MLLLFFYLFFPGISIYTYIDIDIDIDISEADLRWRGRRGRNHLFFEITWKNYKLCCLKLNWSLIIAPLIYIYPNTIKTCLTPNYLLFGKQLLLSSNTTSTVAANLTVLSSTTDMINRISNHFWDRWRHE